MRCLCSASLVSFCLMIHLASCFGQTKASRVYVLEDRGNDRWCAFDNQKAWSSEVQRTEAMVVGTLTYSDSNLSQIDVTETDQSGDWIVYDHYFLNDHRQIVKLSRTINVLPGDRSVVQTFSISNGRPSKEGETQKELSTGKILTSPETVWLPELGIATDIKKFPFSSLLKTPGLGTTGKTCVSGSGSHMP
jgi:hypothetical protein